MTPRLVVLPDTEAARLPLVFVTVGSDYHPFTRLVSWVDGWLEDGGASRARCVMQYGTAPAPRFASGEAFMPHDDVLALMRSAVAVVAQGGPMTMVEARRQGRLPLAVPRTRALREVVDDHQHAFCGHMAAQGQAALATDEATLRQLLDDAVANPERYAIDAASDGDRVDEAVGRFTTIAQRLSQERLAGSRRRHRIPVGRSRDTSALT